MPSSAAPLRPTDGDMRSNLKRSHQGEPAAAPATKLAQEPPAKKRKVMVTHKLRHEVEDVDIEDPIDDPHGKTGGFFRQQLMAMIGEELKLQGFDTARPAALEAFANRTEKFMLDFGRQVQTMMNNSRRTQPIPHDFIRALSANHTRSSDLELIMEVNKARPTMPKPKRPPRSPKPAPEPDLDAMLGPKLSGKPVKESKKWIPPELPAFPPLHTWKSTPVYPERETDPRKIREKALAEGNLAEQSLRKLMEAQKAGIQKQNASQERKLSRGKQALHKEWENLMGEMMVEDAERRRQWEQEHGKLPRSIFGYDPTCMTKEGKPDVQKMRMRVNYERKFFISKYRD